MADRLERARALFDERAWADALKAFRDAGTEGSLDAVDLERMAVSAYLTGEDDESAAAWEAAHRAALEAGDPGESARCAFWLGFSLMLRGQGALAGGWLGRADQVVDEAGVDCAASGYLLIPALLGALGDDPGAARELASRALEIGGRFDDADLRAFATLGLGQALLAATDIDGGTAQLDAAMVAVASGDVGPITSGIVYCAVILECVKVFDVQRASEWTEALSSWCDSQPDLVPYRGQCLVHRSQLQQAAGDWPEAASTADAAWSQLVDPPHPALGLACYQRAELHRLMGALDEAAAGYREASRNGFQPLPGLALLELASGDTEGAARIVRRALAEVADPLERPPLLAAAVEILRADGDVTGGRDAADELAELAADSPSDMLSAMADQAAGSALVFEGHPAAALPRLRSAATTWRSLRMPYEGARAAVMIGLACTALGDAISATVEYDNAAAAFSDLGADPDLSQLEQVRRGAGPVTDTPAGAEDGAELSPREREILAEVAAGGTNREIAERLIISQHTVGRHLENIFAKLGVSSRTAATAYAYEHDLL